MGLQRHNSFYQLVNFGQGTYYTLIINESIIFLRIEITLPMNIFSKAFTTFSVIKYQHCGELSFGIPVMMADYLPSRLQLSLTKEKNNDSGLYRQRRKLIYWERLSKRD